MGKSLASKANIFFDGVYWTLRMAAYGHILAAPHKQVTFVSLLIIKPWHVFKCRIISNRENSSHPLIGAGKQKKTFSYWS